MIKKLLMLFMGGLMATTGSALEIGSEFSDNYGDGQVYCFRVISATEVELIPFKNNAHSGYWGDKDVPATVYAGMYTVTQIGEEAFANATELTSVKLPATIKTIKDKAFYKCPITELDISNCVELTQVGSDAFSSCANLKSLKLPASLTVFPAMGCMECEALEEVSIPGVKTIYSEAFEGCTSLKSVIDYGDDKVHSVVVVGSLAFNNCTSLEEMPFGTAAEGYSLEQMEYGAFQGCAAMTKCGLPYGLTTVGDAAFKDCSSLQTVELPSSVTKIGFEAFMNCSDLTSITLPNSITTIDYDAFRGCKKMQEINAGFYDPATVTLGICVFDGVNVNSCKLYVPKGSVSKYKSADQWKDFTNIEEKEDAVGDYFSEIPTDGSCPKVYRKISMNEVEVIAFTNSTYKGYWGDIVIPSTARGYIVTQVGEEAFANADLLTSVKLPETIKSIQANAFYNCALTELDLSNCTELEFVGNQAFMECQKLKTLKLPASLKEFPVEGCKNDPVLEEVYIPGVKTIKYNAFELCEKLTKVVDYGDDNVHSVEVVGDYAFWACSSLPKMPFGVEADGYSLKTLGQFAFYQCSGMTKCDLPDGLKTIDAGAFDACSSLTAIVIPSTVTSVGNLAFEYCTKLATVTIPTSVKTIGEMAFFMCTGLEELNAAYDDPAKVTLGQMVFDGVPYSTCVLYVPKDSAALYKEADQWKEFMNIEEKNFVGVENIGADVENSTPVYYDLTGREVKNPERGIYVVNGRKVLVK